MTLEEIAEKAVTAAERISEEVLQLRQDKAELIEALEEYVRRYPNNAAYDKAAALLERMKS